jgi:mono/diheme cytochrome c family protein
MHKYSIFMSAFMLAAALSSSAANAQTPDGKTVFATNCAACHQAGGTGIPGAFPALKGNTFVAGDGNLVIATVLKGRGGMPAFAESIDDAQLAAVISYVRTSWGNQAGAVTAADVAAVRKTSGAGDVVKQEQPTNVH